MKKIIILTLTGILGVTIAVQADAPKAQKTDEKPIIQKVKKAEEKPIIQQTCPVMGGKINKNLYYEYKGQRIYVCCDGCIAEVKKDPEKYLKKVNEDIAKAEKKATKK